MRGLKLSFRKRENSLRDEALWFGANGYITNWETWLDAEPRLVPGD